MPAGAHSRVLRRSALATLPPATLLVTLLAWPTAADAHGIFGRAYLPVPAWLFAWAAGIVLIVSFLALPRLWRAPRLQVPSDRPLFRVPGWLGPLCGAIGLAMFVVVLISGVFGSQIPTANLTPTAVFVLFWVGVPVLSVLFGDVFALFNPWRALARGAGWLARRTRLGARLSTPQPYPERLGRWPAVACIFGFAWLELIFVDRDQPATLAVLAFGYALAQLIGMAWFGVEQWSQRGDGLAVAFNLFSRLSPFEYRDRSVRLRRLLSGLPSMQIVPGTVALLCTMIGTTSFDGFMNGPVWRSIAPSAERDLGRIGIRGTAGFETTYTLGMIACILVCAGLYWVGVKGMESVNPSHRARALAAGFVHSLAPIAFGYMLAHYFSLLVTQGQAGFALISDPLGTGANIFGTANFQIDYSILSGAVIWYVQVLALVGGHVSGLALAHDRALVVYDDVQDAADSQRWMLVVMVTFTCLGLWLLSAVNA